MKHTRWMLADTLRRYGQKPPALVKTSGLSKNTVYDIVNGKTRAVTLETLDSLLSGLEQLTGTPMTLDDVLKRETQSEIEPALLAQVQDIQPFDWQAVKSEIPQWTDEERAENERFWRDLEVDRRSRGDRRMLRLEALWEGWDEADGSPETGTNLPSPEKQIP